MSASGNPPERKRPRFINFGIEEPEEERPTVIVLPSRAQTQEEEQLSRAGTQPVQQEQGQSDVDLNAETVVPGTEEEPIQLESDDEDEIPDFSQESSDSDHWWSDVEEDYQERNPEVPERLIVDFEDQWIEGNFSRPTSPSFIVEAERISPEIEFCFEDLVNSTCNHPWYSPVTYQLIDTEKLEKEQRALFDFYKEEIKFGGALLRGQTHQDSQCFKNNTCEDGSGRWCVFCQKHCLLDRCNFMLNNPRRFFYCFRCGSKKHFGRNCHSPIQRNRPVAVVFPMKRKALE